MGKKQLKAPLKKREIGDRKKTKIDLTAAANAFEGHEFTVS